MVLAVPGAARLDDLRSAATARHLAGRRRGGGVQLPGRAAHRRAAWAHRLAADRQGRADATRRRCSSRRVLCGARQRRAVRCGQSADDVADLRHLRRLRGDLHRVLKPLTPQNIVIGGASGAMPPVLGWAAMRGDVGPEALMLCLIIFLWTPPHFWALALYRAEDYRKSGLPMLPVTHGNEFTRLQVLLYTLVLFAARCCRSSYGMSGWLYLAAAVVLGAVLHRLRAGGSGATTPTRSRARPSASRSSTCRCCSRRCWWTTTCSERMHTTDHVAARCSPLGAGRAARPAPAATSAAPRQAAVQGHRHHRRRLRAATSRCPTTTASRARLADFKGKVVGGLLRLHAVPGRLPDDDGRARAGRSRLLGRRRRRRCRACSSRSTPSATRRRC